MGDAPCQARRSSVEAVRAYFQNFAEHQAPQNGSPLYALLCREVAGDAEMLELATHSPPTQPSANLLLAAVHALLLRGDPHPLRDYYPDVVAAERPPLEPDGRTYALFREFVFSRREAILPMLRTRKVQTNVVRRTTVLLPLFATLATENEGLPLALIELGASAGLNLHWDRFRHFYRFESGEERAWGDPDSPVQLSTRVRGSQLPPLPAELGVAWRVGIDLEPIDPDDEAQWLWLRALVFPEHVERHGELEAAADLARSHPTEVLRGDAVASVAGLLARAPQHALVCLYATAVLNQLPRDSRRSLWEQLAEASRLRPLHLVTLEGVPEGWARLQILAFVDGERRIRHLADAHAHGRWIRWLGAQAAGS